MARIISPSRELTNSHQAGLQNKFRFHVCRITSGLFYENSTELDEVVPVPVYEYANWKHRVAGPYFSLHLILEILEILFYNKSE